MSCCSKIMLWLEEGKCAIMPMVLKYLTVLQSQCHTAAQCEIRVYYLLWVAGSCMWFSCFRNG